MASSLSNNPALDRDATAYDFAQGFDAAPSSIDEPDHAGKGALVKATKVLSRKASVLSR